ncbi:recombination protein RecR [Candidatus Uhrbacteria bacterium]|nr:recombination protein RecR [Candidatus Uhrbacteria bacterium]
MQFPPPITRLIQHFRALPGVGPRTAARFVFALLNKPEDELRSFGHALVDLKESIRVCKACFNVSLANPCQICADPNRDAAALCVVARPQDIQALEETREYHGLYHVLGGTLNPIEGVTPEQLRIKELLNRIDNPPLPPLLTSPRAGEENDRISPPFQGGVRGGQDIQEILLALNPDLEGEATALYLAKLLKARVPRVTRLARGLPQGADLEYADEVTLINAIKGRREI